MEYDFKAIEDKWKTTWADKKLYEVNEDHSRPKYYVLDMFPYPSGAGLHVGHPLGYVASDIYARYKRLKGYNVLHPMGYDAFGLPAEQYAIQTGTHPAETTRNAIRRYREQLDKIGFSFDWSREVKTCDPKYYRWTQWIFLQLYNSWYNPDNDKAEPIETLIGKYKAQKQKFTTVQGEKFWADLSEVEQQGELMKHRLVYLSFAEVNWCEELGCVLANDEVKDGRSERGGHPVVKRKMRQWFLRITEYSERLLRGLEDLDWSESLKEQQRNWIGRSEGALINFEIANSRSGKMALQVFTTRPDTIFGATFMVIAPEHDWVDELTTDEQKAAIEKYVAYVKSRSDIERQQEKTVSGEFTGSYALNPFTAKQIPIYIAEYVLSGYGTGAIMAVPADDERDKKIAEKFNLPIIPVIDKSSYPNADIEDKVGKMINSGFLDGMEVTDAIARMFVEIENRGLGRRKINYRQRDAIYSRQRYWGEPIPMHYQVIHEMDTPFGESNDMPYPVYEPSPLELPEVSSYQPDGTGRSPLANNAGWMAKGYETDTMPGYAGSSWYFLRYMDPHNEHEFAAKEKLDYWQHVDIYFGGAEHAVGHLLYSRMWHKVLFDLGYVSTEEPFKKMVNQGMITGYSPFIRVLEREGFAPRYISADLIDWKNKTLVYEGVKYDPEVSTRLVRQPYCYGQYYKDEFRIYERLIKSPSKDTEAFPVSTDVNNYDWQKDEQGENYLVAEIDVEKMSKSKWNVINPDDVIEKYGADCFRMFEMFLGPIEQSKPWDDKGISGVSNFLKKLWRLFYPDGNWQVSDEPATDNELKVLHKMLKKVEEDIERLSFNTCISAMMIAVNELTSLGCRKRTVLEPLIIALSPFAPFISEELWYRLNKDFSVYQASFPKVEQKYLIENKHKYPVSINGKVRAEIELPLDIPQQEVENQVLQLDNVRKWTNGQAPKKFIYVKGKIINVVV